MYIQSVEQVVVVGKGGIKHPPDMRTAQSGDCLQAAALGFRSLLRFFILACQQQQKKEFKLYSIVNRNSTPFPRIGPGKARRPARLNEIKGHSSLYFACRIFKIALCISIDTIVAVLLAEFVYRERIKVIVSLGHSGSLWRISLIDEVRSDFWFCQINSDNTNRIN